jgi:hypothetical protein
MLYNIYIKYIRYRIFLINNVKDIIKIFKNINFFYKNITTDKICEIIIDGFKIFPLSEQELQKLSLLEQNYNSNLGIENYATCILWLCVIQSIQETILSQINTIRTPITELKIQYKISKQYYPFFYISYYNPYSIKYYINYLTNNNKI